MADSEHDALRYIEPSDVFNRVDGLSLKERDVLECVNQKVAAAESLGALLQFLFDLIRTVSPCDRLSLAFLEEDGRRVVSYLTRADYDPILLKKGYAQDLQGSSLEVILTRGIPRIINDLEGYLRLHPDSPSTRLLVREGVRSSLTCPLRVDGRIVGLLFRSSRRVQAYQDRHVQLHLAVAERLSQAVEKAYRIEQLAAANQAYIELLGFVAHELKSPVASMVMDAQLMLDGYLGQLDPRQHDRMQRSVQKGKYLLNLVNEYLDLARIEGGQLQIKLRHGVDFVAEVIKPGIDLVQTQLDNKRMKLMTVFPDEAVSVAVDPDMMKIVMVNLLSNAIKYGYEAGEVKVTVTCTPELLKVSVRNDGPGFEPDQRSRLFRKFSRLDSPELRKQKGTGVGLYTVWRIMQLHQGRIRADSEPGKWAEFAYEIPVRNQR